MNCLEQIVGVMLLCVCPLRGQTEAMSRFAPRSAITQSEHQRYAEWLFADEGNVIPGDISLVWEQYNNRLRETLDASRSLKEWTAAWELSSLPLDNSGIGSVPRAVRGGLRSRVNAIEGELELAYATALAALLPRPAEATSVVETVLRERHRRSLVGAESIRLGIQGGGLPDALVALSLLEVGVSVVELDGHNREVEADTNILLSRADGSWVREYGESVAICRKEDHRADPGYLQSEEFLVVVHLLEEMRLRSAQWRHRTVDFIRTRASANGHSEGEIRLAVLASQFPDVAGIRADVLRTLEEARSGVRQGVSVEMLTGRLAAAVNALWSAAGYDSDIREVRSDCLMTAQHWVGLLPSGEVLREDGIESVLEEWRSELMELSKGEASRRSRR